MVCRLASWATQHTTVCVLILILFLFEWGIQYGILKSDELIAITVKGWRRVFTVTPLYESTVL